jgi:hypothetical protein
MMSSPVRKTSPVSIALAWTLVTIPLAWGVYQSVVKSLPLFHVSGAASPPPVSTKN